MPYGVVCWCRRRGWLRSVAVTQTVDVDFVWCPGPVPEGMPVVQVYGWLVGWRWSGVGAGQWGPVQSAGWFTGAW